MTEQLLTRSFRSDEFVDAIAARPRAEYDVSSPLLAVALSALESNLWGGSVAILDGGSGERLCGFQTAAGVSSVAWTGDDHHELLAFGCDNGDVQLARLSKGEDGEPMLAPTVAAGRSSSMPGHDDVITGVAASAVEKNIFATCHLDLIWDVTLSPIEAHVLATASQDATVQLWDDRSVVQAAHSTLSTQSFAAFSVDWHPTNAHLLAIGLENGSVMTFDTRATQKPLSTLAIHEGAVHCVKYSPLHADLLAVGSDDTAVSIVTNSSSPEARFQSLTCGLASVHSDYVRAVEWHSSSSSSGEASTVLVTGSWDHTVSSWAISDL